MNSPGIATNNYQRAAVEAFRAGRFNESARLAKHALVDDSNNADLHLFLAQAQFAAGDFESAATQIHHAATIGSVDDLGFYVKAWRDYYRSNRYTDAMNRLNRFVADNPGNAGARFLRGYHFLYLEQAEYAAGELAKVIELDPNDGLAKDLLAAISGTDDGLSQDAANEPPKLPVTDLRDGDITDEHAGHDH